MTLSRRRAIAGAGALAAPVALAGGCLSSVPEAEATPIANAPAPSGADDLAALSAALPKAGTLLLQAGVYRLSGPLTLGPTQDLIGEGGNLTDAATVLRATGAGAGLVVGGSASLSGNLLVDGAGVARRPFVRELGPTGGAQRTFLNLSVIGSAEDNVLVVGAQNDTWIGCNAQEAARDNLVLDQGAGGHAFVRCELNAAGRHNLRVDAAVPGGPYVGEPTDNTFDHCIFERENSGTRSAVSSAYLPAFDALTFTACTFYATARSSGPRIDVGPRGGSVTIIGGRILGESPAAGGTGLRVAEGPRVVLAAAPRFQNLRFGIELVSGNPTVHVLGNVLWNAVGARYTGRGDPNVSVLAPFDNPLRVLRDAPGDRALLVGRTGEQGARVIVDADGGVGFNDGVGYVPKAKLFAGGEGVLSMPPTQSLQTGRGPTQARPPAAAVGEGAMFYDTTLHRPIWSTGTGWTDAFGQPV